ncbi:SIMPL domain-containing protein [Paenibacillus sp. J2TS4]|uniref:SIMPL domain-containing protein n=1 Tax=Paenibacillus sp. J2TS4 TaxID=2807194 RepID=UPI001B1DA00D|nr:SIMPL domain-containing protein [Paenibacillus sp. J2TS4]GIP31926.1 hypothetical protein J2TS4_11360 [Paenibacillus sp. J2TS4]
MNGQPINRASASNHSECRPVIEVMGGGVVQAIPDRAVIILGAVTEGPVLQTIQAENANVVNNIIHSLLTLNIPRQKIQTQDYRIEIQYDYQEGKQIFRGYNVTHLLEIITEKVGQTGEIVDTAVAHGANRVTGIRFTMAHPEVYQQRALSLAIRNARNKAITIANALGMSLTAIPCKVQELSRPAEPVLYQASVLAASTVTPVQPGELSISAAVRVWYVFS